MSAEAPDGLTEAVLSSTTKTAMNFGRNRSRDATKDLAEGLHAGWKSQEKVVAYHKLGQSHKNLKGIQSFVSR